MAVQVYDTLQRSKVELVPIDPSNVRLYVCGPTVYGLLHVGNARPLVAFDVAYRHLRRRFPRATYVRNITDLDDKIIRRAGELGEDPAALSARYIVEFHRDAASLNLLPPDAEPKVTESLDDIVHIIERLVERGHAYAQEGDVYFDVKSFRGYGGLSRQPLDQLEAGARVDVDERKRSPLDFALWKAAKPGEPSWPSPWGAGRPGWHIECSAMAERFLGVSFDLHGGGVDLIFPHHENERAQSQGAHGDGTFSKYWLHNGFINFNDKKISKSDEKMKKLLETAFQIRVVVEQHGGEALRWWLMSTHYRHPVNFEILEEEGGLRFPGLEEAERQLEYGYITRRRLDDAVRALPAETSPSVKVADEAAAWLPSLEEGLDDDFNSATGLAALQQGLTVTNRILDGKLPLPKDVKRRTLRQLHADLTVAAAELGVLEADPSVFLAAHRTRRAAARKIDVTTVELAIADRTAARAAKDFARGDAIRADLATRHVELMDTPTGTTWRVTD